MNFCFVFGHEPWLLPPSLEMADVLKEKGHQVSIIYSEYLGKQPDRADYDTGYTSSCIRKQNGLKRILVHTQLAKEIEKCQREKRVDVFIACNPVALQALVAANVPGAKKGNWCFEIVYTPDKLTLSMDFYRQISYAAWVKKMDFFLAPSETRVERELARINGAIPNEVIYNCRAIKNDAHVYKLPAEADARSYKHKLVYTGKISKTQYIDEIIGALEYLPSDTAIFLAGFSDELYVEELKKQIDGKPYGSNVYFLGRLNRKDVYSLINQCDIGFVFYERKTHSKQSDLDPAPNKIGDYISENTWILGTDQPYIKYWLEEKGAGICISEINKTVISEAINKLISSPEFSDKAVLKEIFLSELNMNTQADKLINFIESI